MNLDEKVDINHELWSTINGDARKMMSLKMYTIEQRLIEADEKATLTQKGVHLLCSVVGESCQPERCTNGNTSDAARAQLLEFETSSFFGS